ncbi:polyamine ABC transporter substrate-binding protein [Aureimonas sp. SA4125]|uniref:ABC transporter substrate-binding protein n=1 Tax=Aureimonas sp. SA4125 TaxID=2826993 RepID=UPI001CC4646C|nr:ABC transporter substrate-binding protein [Aureimonas sp. SA4125]BDA83650.1 polyamine ABC transporter substrate-binding protein [Aureimonas sp. SA4125]
MKMLTILGTALLTGTVVQPALAEGTVTIVAYSGLFQERYTKAVVEPFLAAHPDIKVEYFPLQGSAQMLGTLRAQKAAPQADVTIMDMSVAKTGTDEGLFDKIDEKVSGHVADLYPNARFENVAGVAVTFDNLVLLSNTEAVPTAPTTWSVLSDPAYEGKVGLLGAPDLVGVGLTVVLDHMNGGTDPIANIEKGIEAMKAIAPNVQTWEPKPEVYPAIANGQISLGVGWNARGQVNAETSNGRLAVSLPQEGTILQINTINLVKNRPGGDAAHTFVDYALSPEAQKAFTEAMYYAPTNTKAVIAPEAMERTVASSMDKTIPLDWVALASVRDKITNEWRRKVIPLSR